MKILNVLVALTMVPFAALADDQPVQNFPFQPQAFQFRLNQGFFRAGGELLEDILKSSGMIDNKNTIKIKDKATGVYDYLRYKKMKANIRLEEGKIIGDLSIDIAESRIALNKVKQGCVIGLTGPLAFRTTLELAANGSVVVDVPSDLFNNSQMQMGTEGCGLATFLIRMALPSQLKSSLAEAINKVANDQELQVVDRADVGDALTKANVFINVPSRGPLDTRKANSQFDIDLGVHGYLSNARDDFERISITNPRKAHMNQMGLEWSLDAGILAKSKNIYNPTFKASNKVLANAKFPEWGLAPFKKSGQAVDFDGGLMIRTNFLKNLFEKLYEAGFFNLQVQDSLLNKKVISLDPTGWGENLKVVMPNGQPLTKENYADSRLELRLASPPALTVRNEKEFQLSVSDFNLTFYVKTKDSPKEFEVVKLRAKFNLVTRIGMDENARLAFQFNDKPVQEFQIISRSGVDAKVPDSTVETELNKSVVGLLNQSSVEIPFLKGRKIEIKSLSIDADRGTEQALSMYLKIK